MKRREERDIDEKKKKAPFMNAKSKKIIENKRKADEAKAQQETANKINAGRSSSLNRMAGQGQ